jgi:succinyl-CoA synthetase beta subunit
MDLLEYQAKTLFRQMAIPVLPSQRIDYPADLKGLKIPYPVVLKSQVRAGGRGKAGGVKFVENTIDAVAAAQTIFNLPIMEEYPEVLLAEAKYDADQELYLAVFLDPGIRRPVLLGSPAGGVNLEVAMAQMQQVVVDQDFSPFYARRLALKMGLQGNLIQSVSAIIEKMYQLFVEKDLDLVEINPLGISPTGQVMALDGKVSSNDVALGRHSDLAELVNAKPRHPQEVKKGKGSEGEDISSSPSLGPYCDTPISKPQNLRLVELDGNIGILCNGIGLTMATLDVVTQLKGKPANFLNLGIIHHYEVTEGLRDRVEKGLELVSQDKGVKVILVNLLGSLSVSEDILSVIIGYLERKTRANIRIPQIVLRLNCRNLETARESLAPFGVQLVTSLDEGINHAIAIVKG